MKIVVAICTYNRALLLRQTLQKITELHRPVHAEWVVMVINNRCTDDTDAVVSEFSGRLPISYHHEEKQGLSNARNCAIEQTLRIAGDYIIWTDDDVLPDPDWLVAYEAQFQASPDAAIFGGPVDPWCEVDPPQWFSANYDLVKVAYAVIDPELKQDTGPISPTKHPHGANFALRMRELSQYRFDPRLGVNGNKIRLGGEETALMELMQEQGAQGIWIRKARVRHFLPKERLRLSYIGWYYRGVGRTAVVLEDEGKGAWDKKWAWRVILVDGAKLGIAWLTGGRDTARFLQPYIAFHKAWGRLFP